MQDTSTLCQNLATLFGFGIYVGKTSVGLLCSIFSNGGLLFRRVKKTQYQFYQFYAETFQTSLVLFGQVASFRGEEFEKLLTTTDDDDGRQVMAKLREWPRGPVITKKN